MDRLRRQHQRIQAWAHRHPWPYSILVGIWMGLVLGITNHFVDNASFQASASAGLISGSLFTLY